MSQNNTPPGSPPVSPPNSPRARYPSNTRRDQFYTPSQPSNLRQSSVPEITPTESPDIEFQTPFFGRQEEEPYTIDGNVGSSYKGHRHGRRYDDEQDQVIPTESTALLSGPNDFSGFNNRLRPQTSRRYDSFSGDAPDSDVHSAYNGDGESIRSMLMDGPMAEAIESVMGVAESESIAASKRIAAKYGIHGKKRMYVASSNGQGPTVVFLMLIVRLDTSHITFLS
jgi:hypothetical protein